uniref:Protein RRP6-like 2 isoform X1 n=1 Tax=Elaeis guineensis var. tenera TaxID=51953 RepID=A0A6I9RU76_ELAGV|nr:protein RRP6-like 2 isoform X1 [Elaeis guineensis]
MEVDSSPSESSLKHKADSLQALVSGPLAASAARLSGRSRGIPSGKDFHFYNNFDEFKAPAREIAVKSVSSLTGVAASGPLWGSKKPPPFPDDLDEAFDWIVNLNDDFLERFGTSMDEFKSLREKEEENGGNISSMDLDGGFQMVYGKKKKGSMRESGKDEGGLTSSSLAGVKLSSRDKKTTARRSRVPFHIPSIPRPQDQYHIRVNNKNQPFEHVWLERSEDGSRFIHPLEKLSVLDFIDRNVGEGELVKPLPIESTPFKLVDGVNELKELAAKLRGVNEFAVDLEHNQYRSFQGLTCLMQISTRTEDFVLDTLKLRIHVGPYLREIFKDPSKRKVMHGADRDILWLQRDFGIYVCNLFDTGQASRVLQLERNSLEYLLHYFCGVNANKEYQHADWRLRPLPDEMLKYAREDTHYLLHIYDLMTNRLISASTDENDLLLEVYKRSNVICMQLYEKELLTDASYLHIYGLQEADLNSKQLAVVAGLCQWRDHIAREEDESTGYILPNKALLEIAREMPTTPGKLHQLVKFKHPFVERYLSSVISVIRSSVANSTAFESIAAQLKGERLEASPMQDMEAASYNPDLVTAAAYQMTSAVGEDRTDGTRKTDTMQSAELSAGSTATMDDFAKPADTGHFSSPISAVSKCQQEEKSENMQLSEIGCSLKLSDPAGTMQSMDSGNTNPVQPSRKASIVSAQILKKPTCALGALFGNSSSRRKFNADKGGSVEQVKNKVEQIKSTVSLPFHYFSGDPEVCPEVKLNHPQVENQQHRAGNITETVKLEEVIHLDEPHNSESTAESPKADDSMKHGKWLPPPPENCSDGGLHAECDIAEELLSTSDLASSFEKCFQSISERSSHQNQKPSQEPEVNYQLKPFDYAAARKNIKFGDVEEKDRAKGNDGLRTLPDSREMHKGPVFGQSGGKERLKGFQQSRRRQAFPPSGNRSTTYN